VLGAFTLSSEMRLKLLLQHETLISCNPIVKRVEKSVVENDGYIAVALEKEHRVYFSFKEIEVSILYIISQHALYPRRFFQ